jgi:RimJ/RimL family protein N-acetyltransferase
MGLMTERVRIEPLLRWDTALLEALLPVFDSNREFHKLTGDTIHWTIADVEDYLRGESNPAMPALVSRQFAIRDKTTGSIIGTLQLVTIDPQSTIQWISLLMLHAARHREGFGAEIVRAVENAIRADGFREIRLFVHSSTPTSRLFWEDCGYTYLEDATNTRGNQGVVLFKLL